ncbi:MAG: MATE family efflux transporter [Oscillospiraceae bacterium]|nr:MATE family efflux transporter [Oscillospiraceae bacterium]
MNVKKQFAKYVSLNILGMVGMSCYIIADSFFIAKAEGANGLTALNLVLPLYNLIFAIGSMVGVGSAIRYSVLKTRGDSSADSYLFNALFFTAVLGLVFTFVGIFAPEKLLTLLGADSTIVETGRDYTRIFMCFGPIFMWNYVANAYVRNDGAPTVAMIATLSSSLFNIVFDYVLMFPLKMGMKGAALATVLSPVLGITICSFHLFSKRSNVKIKPCVPSIKRLISSCQVGIPAFVGEMSSGVITLVFNYVLLSLAGNIVVAAYGVVANVSLVTLAVFNGIAQGSQPLISRNHGAERHIDVNSLKKLSLIVALVMGIILYAVMYFATDPIVAVFNSEHNAQLAEYANTGVKLYFIGVLFAGLNIVGSSFFSAVEKAKEAAVISVLRGFVLVVLFVLILPKTLGVNGVWLSYPAGEFSTMLVMIVMFLLTNKKEKKQSSI